MTSSGPEKAQAMNCQGRRRRRRPDTRRRNEFWSTRHINGSSRRSTLRWSPKEALKSWKGRERGNNRFYFGHGNGQILLEREEEDGVWKVMTVPGFRFSPTWLDSISRWCYHYKETINRNQIAKEMNHDPKEMHTTSNHLRSSSTSREQPSSSCSGKLPHGRVCLSIRCERMGLTDMELEMIAKWHKEHSSVLSIVKLWLFDNKITDVGAPHLAQLIHEDVYLLEIHISHNSLTNKGAQQIMKAIVECKEASSKPFWLRMEWNTINHDELKQFILDLKNEKGVIVDIPRFHLKQSRGRVSSCLIKERKLAHLRLPWIQCQRLRPSEAPVLMQAKTSWQQQQRINRTTTTKQTTTISSSRRKNRNQKDSSAVRSVSLPLEMSSSQSSGMVATTSSSANFSSSSSCSSTKRNSAPSSDRSCHKGSTNYSSGGPLLIFPDTSALLGLIGCKTTKSNNNNPYLTFDWLETLSQKGKFGNSIPSNERIFFVLCDSVMKQLDGLKKQNAHVGLCVRKLVNSGLEKYGPAGQDFLTILGAHEGEGIIVDRNAELLDSRSHHVFNKGQAIDLKIVEVALFFQQELCQAHYCHFNNNQNEDEEEEEKEDSTSQNLSPNPNNPFCFPVVLFSNDNVQLMAAKSHGLPAFRYTDLQKFNHFKDTMQTRRPLTASVLRTQIGTKATSGLGACAQKSLQDEFDGIVACMKHLMESYEGARTLLGQTREILEGNSEHKLKELKQLLLDVGQVPRQEDETPTTTTSLSSSTERKCKNLPNGSGGNSSGNSLPMESESSLLSDHVISDDLEDDDFPIFGLCLNSSASTTTRQTRLNQNSVSSLDSVDMKSSENNTTTVSSNEISEGSSDDETIPLVRAKLLEWEGLVKSHQHPSRILRWTSGQLYSE